MSVFRMLSVTRLGTSVQHFSANKLTLKYTASNPYYITLSRRKLIDFTIIYLPISKLPLPRIILLFLETAKAIGYHFKFKTFLIFTPIN